MKIEEFNKEAIVLEEQEYEQKIKELNDKLEQIKQIVNGNYYVLDPVALQEIRKIINE